MEYDIVYEEKYIAPGFIIYRKDFKQFIKIFPSTNNGVGTFTFIISDEYQDNLNKAFRNIFFEISEESFLYSAFKKLLVQNIKHSILKVDEGYNQMSVADLNEKIIVTFSKDLMFSKNRNYNAMHLTLNGESITNFYDSLCRIIEEKENDDSKKIFMKMINLQATKIGI